MVSFDGYVLLRFGGLMELFMQTTPHHDIKSEASLRAEDLTCPSMDTQYSIIFVATAYPYIKYVINKSVLII